MADAHTIAQDAITSIDLMERASQAFIDAILPELEITNKIAVFCGTGNNGGDGFAIARILKLYGFDTVVFLVKYADNLSADCEQNYKRLKDVNIIHSNTDIPALDNYNVIIDAIFGSGLSRAVEGIASEVIQSINKTTAKIYSVDVPSGLYCDEPSASNNIIAADNCIAFQRPKLSFFYPANAPYLKNWKVVDIGLDENFIQSLASNFYILDKNIEELLKPRERQSHKGTFGHALIMAGSYGKIGAAVLTSRACLRSGAGLLTTLIPSCGYTILQTAIPEAMCLTDTNNFFLTTLPDLAAYNAIGIGPGIGTNQQTAEVMKNLFATFQNQSLVIDADGLNILSAHKKLLNALPHNTILTPHPKEFERLAGKWNNDEERISKLKEFCAKHHCIIILKDAHTMICTPAGELFFNTTGNAGMATGGSGDVLTGIITGLLAQKYEPLQAALLAVYFHGKAGDQAKKIKGENALIASDIIECLRLEKAV